MSQVLFE